MYYVDIAVCAAPPQRAWELTEKPNSTEDKIVLNEQEGLNYNSSTYVHWCTTDNTTALLSMSWITSQKRLQHCLFATLHGRATDLKLLVGYVSPTGTTIDHVCMHTGLERACIRGGGSWKNKLKKKWLLQFSPFFPGGKLLFICFYFF